jgi:hypothetical protein
MTLDRVNEPVDRAIRTALGDDRWNNRRLLSKRDRTREK